METSLPHLTGNTDIDLNILLSLSYNNLINICGLNRYTRQLCSRESFWRDKLQQDFNIRLPSTRRDIESFYVSQILLHTLYEDVIEKCDKPTYRRICENDRFWRQKLIQDFGPNAIDQRNEFSSYRDLYETKYDSISGFELSHDKIIKAISIGSLPLVVQLFEKYPENNFPDLYKESSIGSIVITAASDGRSDILTWLLDVPLANYVNRDVIMDAALYYGVIRYRLEIVQLLLDKGVNPNMITREKSLLQSAIGGRNLDIIEELLSHGASISYAESKLRGFNNIIDYVYAFADRTKSQRIENLLREYGAK